MKNGDGIIAAEGPIVTAEYMTTCMYIFQYFRDEKNLMLTKKNLRQLTTESWGFKPTGID